MPPRPEAVTAASCGGTYGRSPPVFTSQPLKSKTAPRTGEGRLRRGNVRGYEVVVRANFLDAPNARLGDHELRDRPVLSHESTRERVGEYHSCSSRRPR